MPNISALLVLLTFMSSTTQTTAPTSASSARADDVQIRINGPVNVGTGDTVSTVWVVNGDALVNGDVRDGLVVINGNARVAGRVEGAVVVVNGRLELQSGARVDRDVLLYRSAMTRANDATIGGAVHEQTAFSIGAGAIWLIWLSFTIVVVLSGLAFALLAPTTLAESTSQITTHSGQTALFALIMAGGVPTLATLSFATVIGIPLGLMLLFVVIPTLTFVGYLVSGAALGSALTSRFGSANRTNRYVAVGVGVVVLQCAVGLPVLGGLVGLVASLLGVGALVSRSWTRRFRLAPAGTVPLPNATPG